MQRPHAVIALPNNIEIDARAQRNALALLAAGYVVYAVNPMQVARCRERHSTSGAKSDLVMRICWLRWSGWTELTTARSPGIPTSPNMSRSPLGRIRR